MDKDQRTLAPQTMTLQRDFIVLVGGHAAQRVQWMAHLDESWTPSTMTLFFGCWLDSSSIPLAQPVKVSWEHGKVYIRRDLLGRTPLHYTMLDAQVFACSTRIDWLLSLMRKSPRLHREVLAALALNMTTYEHSPHDLWRGITRVLPNHTVSIAQQGTPTQRVCTTDEDSHVSPMRVLDLLNASMRGHDLNASIALSSGVDSTLLAAIPTARGEMVEAASMIFPSFPRCDESARLARLVHALNVRHHVMDVEDHWVFNRAERAFYTTQTQWGPSMHPGDVYESVFLRRAAERTTTSAVIMGVGADQLFDVHPVAAMRAAARSAPWQLHQWRRAWTAPAVLRQGLMGWCGRYLPTSRMRAKKQLMDLLPSFAHRAWSVPRRWIDEVMSFSAQTRRAQSHRRWLLTSWRWEMLMRNIERTRRRVWPHVQLIFPFLNEALWRAVLDVPPHQCMGAVRGGRYIWDKLPLRKAHAVLGVCAPEIIWGRKAATMEDFVRYGLHRERAYVRSLVHQSVLVREKVVEPQALYAQLDSLTSSDISGGDGVSLWPVLAVEQWLRARSEVGEHV